MLDVDAKPPQQSQDTASLVKRLAGPSVTKAGQTEINRIIAEVSKGSKFYDNEKRKDRELTERIAKILRIKDEVMKEADIQVEAERDLTQFIVHIDMDAFYANVELLTNPDLEGKPFGVGKGVLSTASYEARKYGVRSGMAGFVAKRLCPDLIFVPVNFQKISEQSAKVMAIFKQYDPNMIVAGCDEAYLNITSYCNEHDIPPGECVRRMREKVQNETRLTASAGIAPNKVIGILCGPLQNKPNGQFHLPFEREAIVAFMRDLSIRKLPGVGRVNERLLESIGVKTCGDIYTHRAVIWLMDHYFGKTFLFRAHLGIASNVVEPHQREERKSIGAERTFSSTDNLEKILEKLDEVSIELENDMKENGWAGKTVTLKYKLNTYQAFTRAKSLNRWITKKDDLFNTGKELLEPELPLCVRLIGLRVTKLKDLRAPVDQGIKRVRPAETEADGWQYYSKTEDGGLSLEEDAGADRNQPSSLKHPKPASSSGVPTKSIPPDDSDTRDIQYKLGHDLEDPAPDIEDKLSEGTETALPHTQLCPLCAKELDAADNRSLNAHLDFCLSKGAILSLQAATAGKASRDADTGTLVDWKERRPDGRRKGKRK
ncbi:DNA/RNA polymerase [Phellopilus nigrolimitatus]|nr:DNA/RNA polymerase [Phellopilus nigrolimitatus]